MKEEAKPMIPEEVLLTKIYFIRGKKGMFNRHLAELYGVETKYLKRQVRRNEKRFPKDFMFQLNKEEFADWRSQFVTSNSDKMGLRHPPFAFTEQGVAMLSGVLNSGRAILVNIPVYGSSKLCLGEEPCVTSPSGSSKLRWITQTFEINQTGPFKTFLKKAVLSERIKISNF